MNERSSRSHCVFSFKLKLVNSHTMKTKRSTVHIVDLAGSERQKKTYTTGSCVCQEKNNKILANRLKEGSMINKSLSTLSMVIKKFVYNLRRISGDIGIGR